MKKLKVIIPAAISVIALIAAIIIALSPSTAEPPIDDLSVRLSTAQQYLVELDFDRAIAEFEAMIQIDPKNADAYLGLAQAYIGKGENEKAKDVLQNGFEFTGDERLKALLATLVPVLETTIAETETTTVTTTETVSVTTETTSETTLSETTVIEESLSSDTDEEKFRELLCNNAFLSYDPEYYFIPFEKMNLYYGAEDGYYGDDYVPYYNGYFQGVFSASIEKVNGKNYLVTITFYNKDESANYLKLSVYDTDMECIYQYDTELTNLMLLSVDCGRTDDYLVLEIAWDIGAYTSSTYGNYTYLFDLDGIIQKKSDKAYVMCSSHHMGGAYTLSGRALSTDSEFMTFFETSDGSVSDGETASAREKIDSYMKNISFTDYDIQTYEEGPSFEAAIDKYLCKTDIETNIITDISNLTEILGASFDGHMMDSETEDEINQYGKMYLFKPENFNGSVDNSTYEYVFESDPEYPSFIGGTVNLGKYVMAIQTDGYENYIDEDFQPGEIRLNCYGDPPLYEYPMKRK